MFQFTRKQKVWLGVSIACVVAFVAFTLLVAFVDKDQVGLSHLNQFFWQHCGKSTTWKRITDCIGYAVILGVLGIVAWQIVQWLQRKSLKKVDWNLLAINIVMVCLVAVYAIFEFVVVNYRPDSDKASYPSSHAMLFATVIPLLIYQVWHYVQSKPWRIILTVGLSVLLVIGLVGRLLSGVHWFTDILAGVIISGAFVSLYLVISNHTVK